MAENEKQEGLQMEELEALAGEFTLDDLAEFDSELEFDVSDLESIKPVYTTKEKLKLILMNNTVFSIIKWCFAGLGLVGLVLYILAMVSRDVSDALSDTLSKGVRGVLTTISNLIPVSLTEILVLVAVVGILAYAGFLIYKTIKTAKSKDGFKIAGIWVQFAYVLLAVFGTGFLFYSMCYGVTTNRTPMYKNELLASYYPNWFTSESLNGSMIYMVDQLNDVAVDGLNDIYYTGSGSSRYASSGDSTNEISKAVNACFDAAAEDYPFLKGGEVKAKKLLLSPLYSALGIGSIYSPFTSEVLVNTDYPDVVVPMQVARAIAKQRGITDDSDASFVAFLVCSQYAENIDGSYNALYIKYSAYFDAYLTVGNWVYKLSPELHMYSASALKESAKKNVLAYVKELDALYDNNSSLEDFVGLAEKTSTSDYRILAKLLYKDFKLKIDNGDLELPYNTSEDPLKIKNTYVRYLVAFFNTEAEGEWSDEVEAVYEEYNPEPYPNDGSGVGSDDTAA